ncbi:MAG: DNA recombination/repair protein RecA [Gammaproteobacteria bacterium]|nr:DNA recombination/repair protein RecA [Gammaproteobacteria bacterium]
MAVNIKDKTTGGVMSIVEAIQKKGGAKSAFSAGSLKNGDDMYDEIERLPSGVFAVDYATGGGFPKGKISIIYGPEASGKTNLSFNAINQAQIEEPGKYQVFVDIENHFDPQWTAHMVHDMDRLIVVKVESAEDVINKVEATMVAHDVNCVVVDSLAMMVAQNELESDASKSQVGGSSALIGKLFRKVTARLSQLANQDQYPTVIFINQIRMKIGVMFGNPETMPGGNAPKFMSALSLRVYGKDLDSGKEGMIHFRQTNLVVKKKKVPTLLHSAEYVTCVAKKEGNPLKPGEIDDWNLVLATLKDFGMVVKDPKNGWVLMGEAGYKTLGDIKAAVTEDPAKYTKIKSKLIQMAKAHHASL